MKMIIILDIVDIKAIVNHHYVTYLPFSHMVYFCNIYIIAITEIFISV